MCVSRIVKPAVAAITGRILGQPVAVVVQRRRVDELWREIIERWGVLTVEQVAEATGLDVDQFGDSFGHISGHGLLGAWHEGRLAFPVWQFAARAPGEAMSGVHPQWVLVQGPLTAAGWSPEEVLLWAASPSGRLDGGARPADLLDDDPASAIQAAIDAADGPPG